MVLNIVDSGDNQRELRLGRTNYCYHRIKPPNEKTKRLRGARVYFATTSSIFSECVREHLYLKMSYYTSRLTDC